MSGAGDAWRPRAVAAAYLTLGVLAVFINTGQGLYNPWIQVWNNCTDRFDRQDIPLFSWKTPQFLASSGLVIELCTRAVNDETRFFVASRKEFEIMPLMKYPWTCPEINFRARQYLHLGYVHLAMKDLNLAASTYPDCAMTYDARGAVHISTYKDEDSGCLDLERACGLGICNNLILAWTKGQCG
jgi:hypothetical protein